MKKIFTFIIVFLLLTSFVSAGFFDGIISLFSTEINLAGGEDSNYGHSGAAGDKLAGIQGQGQSGNLDRGQGILGSTQGHKPNIQMLDCEESDNGRDFVEGGFVIGKMNAAGDEGRFFDRCADANTLVEAYCHPWTGFVQFNKVHCSCVEGDYGAFCPQGPFCLDTDKRNNPEVKGHLIYFREDVDEFKFSSLVEIAVGDYIDILSDYCVIDESGTMLRQFKCDSNQGYSSKDSSCGTGMSCIEGVCIKGSQTSGSYDGDSPEGSEEIFFDLMPGKTIKINGVDVTAEKGLNSFSYTLQLTPGLNVVAGQEINVEAFDITSDIGFIGLNSDTNSDVPIIHKKR